MQDSSQTSAATTPVDERMTVSRRQVLTTLGALAAIGAMPGMAHAQAEAHHHGMMSDTPASTLAASAAHCVTMGNFCLAHIFKTLKTGDTSLAKCGTLVENTIAVCEAVVKLTLNESANAKAMATVCMKECEDCAKECRKHAQKHAICEEMAKSCDDTVAAVRKFVG